MPAITDPERAPFIVRSRRSSDTAARDRAIGTRLYVQCAPDTPLRPEPLRPPMSTWWTLLMEKPMRRSPWNAGVVMNTSAVWPLQIQGSLQMYTSLRRKEAVADYELRHRPRPEMRLKPSRGID